MVEGCGRKLADCTKVVYVLVVEEPPFQTNLCPGRVVTHPIKKVGWVYCGGRKARGATEESKHFVPFCEECAILGGLKW